MNTLVTSVDPLIPVTPVTHAAPRVVSIDIFRGLTMAVMIFVNELAGVAGTPWWTNHAPGRADYMTYVDMVFPFFLFIVGMSLPLSIAQRLKRNPSLPALWLHVTLRFVSLLVLGLVLANADDADKAKMGMSGSIWGLLAIFSAALYLNVYGRSERFPRYAQVLRAIGVIGIIALFALYRRTTPGGKTAWLAFGYPEILGLIAYSYLVVCVVYIPTRQWRWAAPFWFVVFMALNIVSAAHLLNMLVEQPWWLWPFSNGSMAGIIFAGIITTSIFLGTDQRPIPARAMTIAAIVGVLMLVAGWICTPLGISKIRATPTWSFYSIGAAMLLFTLLFWICDVKGKTLWAWLLRPAGSNTLTTYLLPDLWYFLSVTVGFTFYDRHFNLGWPAVVKTMAFTVFILLVSRLLTEAKIRLQL